MNNHKDEETVMLKESQFFRASSGPMIRFVMVSF